MSARPSSSRKKHEGKSTGLRGPTMSNTSSGSTSTPLVAPSGHCSTPASSGTSNVVRMRTVVPQQVSDPSMLDSVAGFISDVVPTSYTTHTEDLDNCIQWAHFENGNQGCDLAYEDGDSSCEMAATFFLVLAFREGVQIWAVPATGEASEVLTLRQHSYRVVKIIPNPIRTDSSTCVDLFAPSRPLIAMCDSSSNFCTLAFRSLKSNGTEVKQIHFKEPISNVHVNRQSLIVTFYEKLIILDGFSLQYRASVRTCYPGPGIQSSPIALGPRWLAFADIKLLPAYKSQGGNETEDVQSVTTTVLNAAKSLGRGLRGLTEAVAGGITSASNLLKPSLTSHLTGKGSSATASAAPHTTSTAGSGTTGADKATSSAPNGSQKGVVTIVDLASKSMLLSSAQSKTDHATGASVHHQQSITDSIVAHFVAHTEAIVALQFDASGLLLLTADKHGHDFHLFRIQPHCGGGAAGCSHLTAIHHLYILHRGDTRAKVRDISFSSDSRWATVSSLRGTTHVFPITPYGGNITMRTHGSAHVVNKMSRFQRSTGLTSDGRCGGPSPDLWPSKSPAYRNPRLPPYPQPLKLNPLAQIRQPSGSGGGITSTPFSSIPISTSVIGSPSPPCHSVSPANADTTSASGVGTPSVSMRSNVSTPMLQQQPRSLSMSSDEAVGITMRMVTHFAEPRACFDMIGGPVPTVQPTVTSSSSGSTPLPIVHLVESLFIASASGILTQYDMELIPHFTQHYSSTITKGMRDRSAWNDWPIVLRVCARAQWTLRPEPNLRLAPEDIFADPSISRPPSSSPTSTSLIKHEQIQWLCNLISHPTPHPPLRSEFKDDDAQAPHLLNSSEERRNMNNDNYWLSQVEMVTYSGPHRRLWMGPQFTFKTYVVSEGNVLEVNAVEVKRSKPINVQLNTGSSIVIESGSASTYCERVYPRGKSSRSSSSKKQSVDSAHNTSGETSSDFDMSSELQIKADLADAMQDISTDFEPGKSPSVKHGVRIVNPLGSITTIFKDNESTNKDDGVITVAGYFRQNVGFVPHKVIEKFAQPSIVYDLSLNINNVRDATNYPQATASKWKQELKIKTPTANHNEESTGIHKIMRTDDDILEPSIASDEIPLCNNVEEKNVEEIAVSVANKCNDLDQFVRVEQPILSNSDFPAIQDQGKINKSTRRQKANRKNCKY